VNSEMENVEGSVCALFLTL